MTDLPPEGAAPSSAPQLRVLAQYVRDSSFENPLAPQSLRSGQGSPQVQLGVDLGARKVAEDADEVSLRIRATAKRDEETVFIAELLYAGVFQFNNIPDEQRQPLLMIECPRLLFPFARQVLSDMTREGGFPPVMLEPIDFSVLYRQRLAQQAQEGAGNGAAQGEGSDGGDNGPQAA